MKLWTVHHVVFAELHHTDSPTTSTECLLSCNEEKGPMPPCNAVEILPPLISYGFATCKDWFEWYCAGVGQRIPKWQGSMYRSIPFCSFGGRGAETEAKTRRETHRKRERERWRGKERDGDAEKPAQVGCYDVKTVQNTASRDAYTHVLPRSNVYARNNASPACSI